MHRRRFLVMASAFTTRLALAQPPRDSILLTPPTVEAGSPELLRVELSGATAVNGEWLGRKIAFFRSRETPQPRPASPDAARSPLWIALAGVDVEAPSGPSTLHIAAVTPSGSADQRQTIIVHPAHYRTAALSVAPRFVQPPPQALAEIEAESRLKEKIFAASASEPLWHGSFHAPVSAAPTDSFGTRRMFNGKLASIHKGANFRAPMGTPVHASNHGTVVLARSLYYEGNCVVLDHGMGLFTLSMHFSRIDVREGQPVVTGDRLGLSGATGRVTGPHLHWAVRWQGAYLDPLKLLRLNLAAVSPR